MGEALAKRIIYGECTIDKSTGDVVYVDCTAATLSVIRQFLKDNDVTDSAVPDSFLDKICKSLPQAFDDDEGDKAYH